MTTAPAVKASTWAPLHHQAFRALWLAALVSNIGNWMQTVGAQWLLVSQPNASILVALVQTANMLPVLLVVLPAGVLADTLDKRWLLVVLQGILVVAGALLAILTFAGQMTPALLLLFTVALGAVSAASTPAYQAIIPELVPRPELPAAVGLTSININLARAIGPAIAGVIVAQAGVEVVFTLNAVTFLVFGLAVLFWRAPASSSTARSEPFISALRAGSRYVRYAPTVRRILLRSALFLVPASALWALLPLVASQQLGLSASGYGLLLGALGVGAVAGGVFLPRLNARLSPNALLLATSIEFALGLVVVVVTRNLAVILIVLVLTGIAWIAVLASVNTALQLFLPAWVRARGLALYQIVLFGSQACGAVLWGILAGSIGLVNTFLVAAAILIVGVATIRLWPFLDTSTIDRTRVEYWPEPKVAPTSALDGGPVVVTITYTVTAENEQRFLQAMSWVRRSRLRTGATEWRLLRDTEAPTSFQEYFVVPSWDEHLRQNSERQTGADQSGEEQADALSESPPRTTHFIAARVHA